MTEFRPILHGDPGKLERLLLSSSQLDVPPRNAKRRAFALLGLGSSVIATTQVTGLATATAAVKVAGSVSAAATGSSAVAATAAPGGVALALLKGLAIGAVTGSLAYGSLTLYEKRAQTLPSHASANAAALAMAPERNERAIGSARANLDAPSTPLSHESGPLNDSPSNAAAMDRRADHTDVKPSARTSRQPAKAATEGTLGDARTPEFVAAAHSAKPTERQPSAPGNQPSLQSERATIELAQALILRGNSAAALRTLSARAWRHLAPEATLVQIEALLALGRVPEAQRLGSQFLSSQPDGPYAHRVRTRLNR